jgi:hypothetical protein
MLKHPTLHFAARIECDGNPCRSDDQWRYSTFRAIIAPEEAAFVMGIIDESHD